jgi:UDP-glucose 4-epimerase
MKFLVTGGAGFIGSHLVRHLAPWGEVTVLDNLSTGREANLQGISCRRIHGSILESKKLSKALEGASHVFHLAAMVSVPESVQKPELCRQINVEGTRSVLETSARAGVLRVVLASSCAIYGNDPTMPKQEDLPPAPLSPYAESKWEGEKLCSSAPLSAVALRFFNVYGPRQDPEGPYAAAVPKLLQAAQAGTALPIHGDGLQTRDFVYVEDVTSALIHVATHPSCHGVYNVASGHSVSILELAQTILSVTGSKSSIEHSSARDADVRHSSASIGRLQATGWNPSFTLLSGLKKMLSPS